MSEDTAAADLTATRMLELFRKRALSPVEAARAVLARIRAHDPAVNAYCLVDEATTLAAARASEERWSRGEPKGLVDGVPVAIKDVFLTRGWPTLKGSKVVDPAGPWEADAPAVAALRRNGMVPSGKTTTPELGWCGVTDSPLTGVTRNPWDPTKTAGGSSGGSAAAVPLGMGPLTLGTDAGGSIRIPAAFCGIFGHKPTHGRAPMWPPSPFYPLAHVGPMTRTVEDAALLLDVLAEPDARDATLPPPESAYREALGRGAAGLRIAWCPRLGEAPVDPEIAEATAQAARAFEALGAQVEEVPGPGFADPVSAFEVLFYGGAAQALRARSAEERSHMTPGLVAMAERFESAGLLDATGAAVARLELIETTGRLHERYDLLLSPALPIPAFEAGREVPEGWPQPRWHGWTPTTYPYNLTGQPACSLPCGFTRAGLPIGLQIVGARHRDDLVLAAAHAYERAHPFAEEHRPALLERARS